MKNMPYKRITVNLPFNASDIFSIIIGVEHYPTFIPHCSKIQIHQPPSENEIIATMHIDYLTIFKKIHFEYTSKITLDINSYKVFIEEYEQKYFKKFESVWEVRPTIKGCEVIYDIKFEIKNPLLNLALANVFIENSQKMIDAFTKRAYKILTPIA